MKPPVRTPCTGKRVRSNKTRKKKMGMELTAFAALVGSRSNIVECARKTQGINLYKELGSSDIKRKVDIQWD
jgi:hypothetical protein